MTNLTAKFPLISGNLSLDLVNTEIVRRGKRLDLLLTEQDMLDWIQVALEASAFAYMHEEIRLKFADRKNELRLAILKLRSILRENFEIVADQQMVTEAFISFLEEQIEIAPFTYKFLNGKLIPFPVGEIEHQLVSLIAFDTLILIDQNKLTSIKRCTNPECVLLFIDEFGRRKWCSMKICGNRKKVRRFHENNTTIE